MKVTISDVARLAGVSTATVSHTINSTRYVSGETKEKVYRAIAELGYTPDASARSFRTGKKKTIGFIVPDISNKFFATMIESVENYLSAHGYHLIIANTKEDMDREETNLRLLSAGLVDGLLVASTMDDFQRLDQLIPAGFPVVLVDRTFEEKKYSSVCVSNFQPIYRSVCRLAGKGDKRIGIIGGGQLGRMMALSARYMGFRVGVLDPTPNCPTGQVADFQITAEYDDKTAIHDLAVQSDVLTYEFENVDAGAIDEVRGITATPQGTDLLRVTQHRVREKQFINDHGTATAPWRAVNNFDELDAALGDIHYPAVLKTVSGGYDGHGQLVLRSDADLEKIRSRSDRGGGFPPSILEGFVDFAFEASILVSGNGKDFVTFPIVRNEHRNNILHMTIAPAEVSEHVAREAHELAIRLAKGFELAGTLAIELFITKDDQVIVNELAPRPHNSGHYTIEACSMDQFDAHIRGIAGWPLPKPKLLSPAVMVNVLGQHVEPTRALIATHPEWNVHDYGKAEVRHDRKMGHNTVITDDPAKTVADLEATGCWDDLKKKA